MFNFENSLVIDRPVEQVYAFLADLENLPKWNYFVHQVSKTSPEPVQVGSTYHQVRESDEQDLKITGMEQDQILIIETIPPSKPEFRREMVFAALEGGTQIDDRWQIELGVPEAVVPYVSGQMKASVARDLKKLKQLLETGEVRLQDGREIRLE